LVTSQIKFKADNKVSWNEVLPAWDLDHAHISDIDFVKIQVFDKDMVNKGVKLVGESVIRLQSLIGYAAIS
jgi:hypothetical protein